MLRSAEYGAFDGTEAWSEVENGLNQRAGGVNWNCVDTTFSCSFQRGQKAP